MRFHLEKYYYCNIPLLIFRLELNTKKDQYDYHTTTACPFLRRLWDVCSPEEASGGRAMESGSRGAGVERVVD